MAAIDSPVNDEFVASNYNSIGNGNGSNWITDAEDWVTKGVPLAISSGVAQMWNSIGWAGNKIANIGSDNPEPFTDNLDSSEATRRNMLIKRFIHLYKIENK